MRLDPHVSEINKNALTANIFTVGRDMHVFMRKMELPTTRAQIYWLNPIKLGGLACSVGQAQADLVVNIPGKMGSACIPLWAFPPSSGWPVSG
jgi:hypothetical protein